MKNLTLRHPTKMVSLSPRQLSCFSETRQGLLWRLRLRLRYFLLRWSHRQ